MISQSSIVRRPYSEPAWATSERSVSDRRKRSVRKSMQAVTAARCSIRDAPLAYRSRRTRRRAALCFQLAIAPRKGRATAMPSSTKPNVGSNYKMLTFSGDHLGRPRPATTSTKGSTSSRVTERRAPRARQHGPAKRHRLASSAICTTIATLPQTMTPEPFPAVFTPPTAARGKRIKEIRGKSSPHGNRRR